MRGFFDKVKVAERRRNALIFLSLLFSETGRIRFQGARFQTPNSVSFDLTEFGRANSASSFQPIICVPKRTHRVSRRTHWVCCRTQRVLFRSSTFETVFRPLPIFCGSEKIPQNSRQISLRKIKKSPMGLCRRARRRSGVWKYTKSLPPEKSPMYHRADFWSNFWEVLGVLEKTSKKFPPNTLHLEIST